MLDGRFLVGVVVGAVGYHVFRTYQARKAGAAR